MNKTTFLRKLFCNRYEEINYNIKNASMVQKNQLSSLIEAAQYTEWGHKYGYSQILDYKEYIKHVPLQTYEDVKPYVSRMREGEQNVLWNGEVKCFAKSSGTTNDKSKFIPVSEESLKKCHYQGGQDVVTLYLEQNKMSNFFSGKGLILGGSHGGKDLKTGYLTGDLSALLIENINPLANLIRVPSKKIALMSEWEHKMQEIIRTTVDSNVTNLSGVPSWFLTLLKELLRQTGKNNLLEIWPNLEVFFHGGIAFTPYREDYKKLIPSDQMNYMETYNASEGFFGIQNDLKEQAMLLMLDLGVFYEFIPMSEFDSENPVVLPLWEVETDVNYALVITTNSGLWRYLIGDTVKFVSTNPYKFIITGRTKHFINAFGEEVIIDNAEKALKKATEETGAVVKEYTAAPVYMSVDKKGRHQWLVEFYKKPDSLDKFTRILDDTLQAVNSDYEAKRYKDFTLMRLEVIEARPLLFEDWLRMKGKLGGQHKVPRLSNSRKIIEDILKLNK